MNVKCGCAVCAGSGSGVASASANRPGRDAIDVRVGTHETFLATMKQRISSPEHRAGLAGLSARDSGDASIAMLDAWATVADVLTFYQERIANEGYLRTAREAASLDALAHLVGYEPRPGVASSVYLAYTVDDSAGPVTIPAGRRAQSIGGAPQTFETSADLEARSAWNNLQVRLTRPQRISVSPGKLDEAGRRDDQLTIDEPDLVGAIFIAGTTSNLKPNDKLLFVSRAANAAVMATISLVTPDAALSRTRIDLVLDPNTPAPKPAEPAQPALSAADTLLPIFSGLLKAAAKLPSVPPSSAARLGLTAVGALSDPTGDAPLRLLTALKPEAAAAAFAALQTATVTADQDVSVYTLTRTSLFGAAAPKSRAPQPIVRRFIPESLELRATSFVSGDFQTPIEAEWKLPPIWRVTSLPATPEPSLRRAPAAGLSPGNVKTKPPAPLTAAEAPALPEAPADSHAVSLDGAFENLRRDSWLVLSTEDTMLTSAADTVLRAGDVRIAPRAAFGLAGKVTRVELLAADGKPYFWLNGVGPVDLPYDPNDGAPASDEPLGDPPSFRFDALRRTVVYLPGVQLALAEVPDDSPVPIADGTNAADSQPVVLPLAAVYSGFTPGRWVIVSGERADVITARPSAAAGGSQLAAADESLPPEPALPITASGVQQSELAMVLAVRHSYDQARLGDRVRSSLVLARPLSYTFKRSTLRIFGNVVDATLGETHNEVLGAGDATLANQTFALKQPPLTYVPAPTASGVKSTLDVVVNGVRFHEVDGFDGSGPRDRVYMLQRDEAGKTSIVFGDGRNGARLPSGVDNVLARYRSGIGKAGNVAAGQISTPVDRPPGVREVVNPLRASGGADRDRASAIRKNAPASIRALDRLVSVQDYADFAATFAGIGKASAVKLSNGLRDLVHVTIAGIDDVPILSSSDLFRDLLSALRSFGDPQLPIALATRNASFLVIDAEIELDGEHPWESVQPALIAGLRARFSFEMMELGSSVHASQVLTSMLSVAGVRCANLTTFTSLPDSGDLSALVAVSAAANSSAAGLVAPIEELEGRLAHVVKGNANEPPPWPIEPAAIVYLSADVPETLTLQEKKQTKP